MGTVINQSNPKSVYKHIKILNNIKYIFQYTADGGGEGECQKWRKNTKVAPKWNLTPDCILHVGPVGCGW